MKNSMFRAFGKGFGNGFGNSFGLVTGSVAGVVAIERLLTIRRNYLNKKKETEETKNKNNDSDFVEE